MEDTSEGVNSVDTRNGRFDNNHVWRLTTNLLDLQKSGKFCDVQLLCLDGTLMAHSAVLVSACSELHATIQHQHMHLPMMDYTLETVQRMVSYLYTGRIEHPPPDEMQSFQNLMESLGLPHTVPSETSDEHLVSPQAFPVALTARIDQDIKPQLAKELDPGVSLPVLRGSDLTFEAGTIESDDDMDEINIKEEIDFDEPSTSETPEPNDVGSRRGRKRKTNDDFVDYYEEEDDYYTPTKRARPRKRATPKRASFAKPKRITPVASAEDEGDTKEEGAPKEEADEEGDEISGTKTKKKLWLTKPRTVPCKLCGEVVEDIVEHKELMHQDRRKSNKVRTCPICNYRGHQLIGFIYHMMKEHNDTSYGTVEVYKCDDCSFQSCYPWRVQEHCKRVHDPKDMYTSHKVKEFQQGVAAHQRAVEMHGRCRTVRCKYCGDLVDDIVEHKAKAHAEIREKTKVRICPICNYRGHQLTTFIYHMMMEHNDTSHGTVQIYKCDRCDFQSCFQGSVMRHAKDVHDRVKENERRESEDGFDLGNVKKEVVDDGFDAAQNQENTDQPLQPGVTIVTAESQPIRKPRISLPRRRERRDGPRTRTVTCKLCGETVANIGEHKVLAHGYIVKKENKIEITRPKTVCEICGVSVQDVKAHVIRMHSDSKPVPKMYICPACGWQTKDTSSFKFHMMTKHNDTSHGTVKLHSCQHCNYKHYYIGTIRKHEKMVHERRRDYQCDICGQAVCTKSTLEQHKLSHSEEGRASLKCPYCTYTTCWKGPLQRHIRVRHTETNVRWPCRFCSTTFKDKDILRVHLKKKHEFSSHDATALVKYADEIPTGNDARNFPHFGQFH